MAGKISPDGGLHLLIHCSELVYNNYIFCNPQVMGGRLINVFGRAESINADVSVGTNTKTCYHAGFVKPIGRSLYKK